jgi:hypothetical protein
MQYNPAATLSITGSGTFTTSGSGNLLTITGSSFEINNQTAYIALPNQYPTERFNVLDPGVWVVNLDAVLTDPSYFGAGQTLAQNSNGHNASSLDNLLLLNDPTHPFLLDEWGITFYTTTTQSWDGPVVAVYNIFALNGELYWNEEVNGAWVIDPLPNGLPGDNNSAGGDPLSFNPTPEPSSYLLLGTGLLLMAAVFIRKVKPGTVPSL